MLEVLTSSTKEAPVERYAAGYGGQQYVGIDLHRRRSVVVRTTDAARSCGLRCRRAAGSTGSRRRAHPFDLSVPGSSPERPTKAPGHSPSPVIPGEAHPGMPELVPDRARRQRSERELGEALTQGVADLGDLTRHHGGALFALTRPLDGLGHAVDALGDLA